MLCLLALVFQTEIGGSTPSKRDGIADFSKQEAKKKDSSSGLSGRRPEGLPHLLHESERQRATITTG